MNTKTEIRTGWQGPDFSGSLQVRKNTCRQLCRKYNESDSQKDRDELLEQILQTEVLPKGLDLSAPVHFSLGNNTRFGNSVTIGPFCRFEDEAPIRIGSGTIIDSGCAILTQRRPLQLDKRKEGLVQFAAVTIEEDVWIGANCTILPGVLIGQGAVIAPGSVVSKDVPAGFLAAGSEATAVRDLRTARQSQKEELPELPEVILSISVVRIHPSDFGCSLTMSARLDGGISEIGEQIIERLQPAIAGMTEILRKNMDRWNTIPFEKDEEGQPVMNLVVFEMEDEQIKAAIFYNDCVTNGYAEEEEFLDGELMPYASDILCEVEEALAPAENALS